MSKGSGDHAQRTANPSPSCGENVHQNPRAHHGNNNDRKRPGARRQGENHFICGNLFHILPDHPF
jgi:hypothetical protein